jgi:hypothetical protein
MVANSAQSDSSGAWGSDAESPSWAKVHGAPWQTEAHAAVRALSGGGAVSGAP